VVNVLTADLSVEELRTRSRVHSSPLGLPCETHIHILLFTIDDTKRTPTWTAILPTCHHLPSCRGGYIACLRRVEPDRDLRTFVHARRGKEPSGQLARRRPLQLRWNPYLGIPRSSGSPRGIFREASTWSIPGSSQLFHNLKNLHAGLQQVVSDIAPINRHSKRFTPNVSFHDVGQSKRVATLFHLKSLTLPASAPETVSILDHLNLPVIAFLTLGLSGLRSSRVRLFFPTIFSRTICSNPP